MKSGELAHYPIPWLVFFRNLFDKNNLVDVQPTDLVPTWRNGRSGTHSIQKWLDRVYASDGLLVNSARFRSWVVHPYFSDHSPVFLQIERGDFSVASPFKFNPTILGEATFGDLVKAEWSSVQGSGVIGAQRRLAQKLHNIKVRLKSWIAEKKRAENRALISLEEQITTLTKERWEADLSSEAGSQLKALEAERNKLMMEEEAHWRLKSRAVWIHCGDSNTKYFHHFTSYRQKKFMWEIKDDQGHIQQGQEALKKEAKRI
jgi:hypothetical protein